MPLISRFLYPNKRMWKWLPLWDVSSILMPRKARHFVKDADNGEKYFFHISSAPATIAEGDRVTFEIERGMRGMNAVRISIVTE